MIIKKVLQPEIAFPHKIKLNIGIFKKYPMQLIFYLKLTLYLVYITSMNV